MAKKSGVAKAVTKTQLFVDLAEKTELSRKQIGLVFDGLTEVIKRELGKKGAGTFTVPGLMKIKVVRKKATKERKGINTFTGLEQVFKAKPARNVVKVLALRRLKEMV